MTSQPPERPIMLCQRVDDRPAPGVLGSLKLACVSCGTSCWVSPASQKQAVQMDASIWCTVCGSAKLGDSTEVTVAAITAEQMQEIWESQK